MTSKSLVLCRYNEDIEWVKKFKQENLKIFVYDKGDQINFEQENLNLIKLDNVGRECHAYLYHIITNYDNLTDEIYFSQSYPFPHIPNYIDILSSQLLKNNIQNGFEWIGPKIVNDIAHNLDFGSQWTENPSNGHPNPYKMSIKKIYELTFKKKCPEIPFYHVSGNFFVSKFNILKYKKEVYQKLLNYLDYPEQKNFCGMWKSNCVECHILERMWGVIFNNMDRE